MLPANLKVSPMRVPQDMPVSHSGVLVNYTVMVPGFTDSPNRHATDGAL